MPLGTQLHQVIPSRTILRLSCNEWNTWEKKKNLCVILFSCFCPRDSLFRCFLSHKNLEFLLYLPISFYVQTVWVRYSLAFPFLLSFSWCIPMSFCRMFWMFSCLVFPVSFFVVSVSWSLICFQVFCVFVDFLVMSYWGRGSLFRMFIFICLFSC